MHEQQLLQQVDTISVMRHLKCCAKLTFDVEGLVKVSTSLDVSTMGMDRDLTVWMNCQLQVDINPLEYGNDLRNKARHKYFFLFMI